MNRKRQRTTTVIIAASALAFSLYPTASVHAARKGGKKKQQQQQQPATPAPAPTPTPAPDSPSPASKGAVPPTQSPIEAAEQAVTQAQTALDAFVTAKQAAFDNSAELTAAKDAVAKSTAALEAIEAPLRQKLKDSNTDYAMALDEIVGARQKLNDALDAKKSDEFGADRAGVKYFQDIITKAEAPILVDPALKKAQAQLDADKARLAALENGFQRSLDADADYRALSNALDNAKTGLSKAQTAAAAGQ